MLVVPLLVMKPAEVEVVLLVLVVFTVRTVLLVVGLVGVVAVVGVVGGSGMTSGAVELGRELAFGSEMLRLGSGVAFLSLSEEEC